MPSPQLSFALKLICFWLAALVVTMAWLCGPAQAQVPATPTANILQFLPQLPAAEIFPGSDRLGPVEGSPAAAGAFAGDKLLGYVFLNSDAVNATGYSGKPIHVAVAMDMTGTIVGAKLLKHSEPIVLIGIPERKVLAFINGYIGLNVLQAQSRRNPPVDIISGATVTVIVIGDTITRAAVKVARSRGIGGQSAPPEAAAAPRRGLDMAQAGAEGWEALLGGGSVRRLYLTLADVNDAFARSDARAAERPEAGDAGETFIDLYAAPVSVPVIGRSLLGEQGYQSLRQRLEEGQNAILVMGTGRYSFRGSGYVRGGIFDRIEVIQDDATIRFRDRDYERIGDLAADGAPGFPEIGLFVIPKDAGFDPVQPWRLQLLVQRAVGALDKAFLTFDLAYELPEKYLIPAPPPSAAQPSPAAAPVATAAAGEEPEAPLWQRIWRDRLIDIAVLGIALAVLTVIFFFQDQLVRRPRLTWWVRNGFLLFTLVWLGWYANAQLSVVNILTLTNSLITEFSWDFFLMDPLLFILWSAVAASLLFWGRGAFCGWLCPFGALQEFLSRIAKLAKIPQITVPWGLHERLWPIKYIVFLGLFGFSIYSLTWAEHLAEEEPFKTAIILKFVRDWPFVLYAGLLLGAGLFIERFYCRYLCPLGAALAIPARLRMFEWLKRHRECGNPCQRCANECPVQSIHPLGQINPHECIYCMHCQTLYWDDHRCPHMIQKRLRRERSAAMQGPSAPVSTNGGETARRGADAFNPTDWAEGTPRPVPRPPAKKDAPRPKTGGPGNGDQ